MKKLGFATLAIATAYIGFRFLQSPKRILKTQFNLCFIRDTPGASEDFVTYTPYNCDDKTKIPIGDPLEGQWAELSDVYLDSDGTLEIVIESNRPFFDASCVLEDKSVWKMIRSNDGRVSFDLISRTEISGPC